MGMRDLIVTPELKRYAIIGMPLIDALKHGLRASNLNTRGARFTLSIDLESSEDARGVCDLLTECFADGFAGDAGIAHALSVQGRTLRIDVQARPGPRS